MVTSDRLLYLKNVLSDHRLLIDKDPDARSDFLERYGVRFRECEGLFDFRNSLIHRYWTVDDARLIDNILNGRGDFDEFIEEVEAYLKS